VAAEERGTLGISWRKWRREIHPPEDLIPSVTHVLLMEEGRIIAREKRYSRRKSSQRFSVILTSHRFPLAASAHILKLR
jgi:hypothetical protein